MSATSVRRFARRNETGPPDAARQGGRRRALLLTGLVTAGLAGGILAPAAANAAAAHDASAQQQTITFNYTGSDQTWTVPTGVTAATFTARGAQGGKATFNGGYAGIASSSFAVTPGEVIHLQVGGMGQSAPQLANCVLTKGSTHTQDTYKGGYNGGGDSGPATDHDCGLAAGGGGASDVRIGGTDLAHRVLVAGGGGGGSDQFIFPEAGRGGYPNGDPAQGDGGGSGGDQTGRSGSGHLGQGATGAPSGQSGIPGSGGGGGYYGGGGGTAGGYGGGGGSSYGPPGTQFSNGVSTGNGNIAVTFGGTPPTIHDITPAVGQPGSLVMIDGTNLDDSMVVTFGSTVAKPSCADSTTCTVQVPADGSGTVPVRVLFDGQQSVASAASQFTYLNGPLTLSSISPQAAAPGDVITFTGKSFVPGMTNASFGDVAAAPVDLTCTSTTTCTGVVPRGLPIGPSKVEVHTNAAEGSQLPFTVLPSVTHVGPATGSATGGTVVTITGTGFSTAAGATTVTFGTKNAIAVGCQSSTTCTAVSPPGSGAVDIRVSVAGEQSSATSADRFTYAG